MSFNKKNIAEWVLNYLAEHNYEQDSQLHWLACNHFLSRNEIIYSKSRLERFSDDFDDALRLLAREFFICYKGNEIWSQYKERSKEDFEKTTKEEYKSRDDRRCFYIIDFGCGVKIGISSNFNKRILDYRKPWCKPIKECYIINNPNNLAIEKHLKKCFKDHTVKGSTEYFNLPFSDIRKEIEAAYPMSLIEYFSD